MYGFYSKIQEDSRKHIISYENKKNVRFNIYLNDAGNEVITTEVSHNKESIERHSNNFPDSQYLGKLTKWVRCVYW